LKPSKEIIPELKEELVSNLHENIGSPIRMNRKNIQINRFNATSQNFTDSFQPSSLLTGPISPNRKSVRFVKHQQMSQTTPSSPFGTDKESNLVFSGKKIRVFDQDLQSIRGD